MNDSENEVQMEYNGDIMPTFTCGCYEPQLIYAEIYRVLTMIDEYKKACDAQEKENPSWCYQFSINRKFPDTLSSWYPEIPLVDYLVLSMIDDELIEHGSIIRQSWLTNLGKAYLTKLNECEGDYSRLGFWIQS